MDFTTLCTVVASLTVVPYRIQFFQYEEVRLSCGEEGNSSEWTVRRKILRNTTEHIPPWEQNGSSWLTSAIYPGESGLYWCESEGGQCSNVINITVTAFDVILETPSVPMTEGDNLTLTCRNRNPSPNRTSDFYKDGVLIGSSSTGTLTILSVSASDEGLYMCNMSGSGPSPYSWLSVRGGPGPAASAAPLTHILLPVVGVCLMMGLLMLLYLWRRHKGKNQDVSYTDVIIAEDVQPRRSKDVESAEAAFTLYSTIKLEHTQS
ncbi:low affinity immunoglobulin gamma Fc region receptor II-like [Sphaeramia orbicularis]|uniref:low affinity immunoglobulin gamma Fc region receptor II-like n=1 Tax=Sphaeramia orbicularis TaxID=375764 RepID=UPI00118053C8|nr:low affinity immunoglobulin gamma Fc region receptor II-like [Sphaeramia orbicularis]